MIKHYLLLVSFLFIFQHLSFAVHNQYTVQVLAFQECQGPKRMNCTVVKLKKPNDHTLQYDIRVKQNVTLTHGSITARSADNSKVLPFQMKKPCDHYVVKQALVMFLKITDDCVLLKNRYVFLMKTQELAGMHPYLIENTLGDWSFHSVFYGKNCNVLCNYLRINTSRTDRPTP